MKLRAWDDVLEEMLYSEIEQFDDMLGFRFEKHFETENPIYMRETGLKDKNGVEIFEGDIIRQTYHAEIGHSYNGTEESFDGHHIGGVVIIASKGACMKNPLNYSEETGETTRSNQYKNVAGYRCVVIGNKFDNPELVEG